MTTKILVLIGLLALAIASPTLRSRDYLSIKCLEPGTEQVATWEDKKGRICTYTAVVGSNFGKNDNGDYSCNGRCGAGCGSQLFSPHNTGYYTQDCFSHDVCEYFMNNTSPETSDANCVGIKLESVEDILFGGLAGCKKSPPSKSASPPTTYPKCVNKA